MDWIETYRVRLNRSNATGMLDGTEEEWLLHPLASVMQRLLHAPPDSPKHRLFDVDAEPGKF